jgi:hypothetical protein
MLQINGRTRATMDEFESDIQSFIIRVWVEDHSQAAGKGTWRGQITHVSNSQFRYLKNLDEIGDFISPYLEEMGVKPGMRRRIRRWLKSLIGRG